MMTNLQSLTRYKEWVAQQLLSDAEFVRLLTGDSTHILPAQDLMYNKLYPYDWFDGTQTEAESFVCLEVDPVSTDSKAVQTICITIEIIVHRSLMRIQGEGIRRDLLADRVDDLINGNSLLSNGKKMNLGVVQRSSCKRATYVGGYYGRTLRYEVQAISLAGESLWQTW